MDRDEKGGAPQKSAAIGLAQQAEQNAARFAYNLCERLYSLKVAESHKATTPVCDPEYIAKLKAKAKLLN